ncbi:MAG TPA: DUF599 family protein [Beijerinckiaceae bacterium]|nr:DUF599 family protein [Beijerinckiaceae bacterium]
MAFSLLDWVALAFFVAAWIAYHVAVELTPAGGHSLNRVMNEHRRGWMERMLSRENRVVDTTIMASLQNGTAFFASTSLLAVGGSLALLRTPDEVLGLFDGLPFGSAGSRAAFEAKALGLAVIFVYAFFKFAWSYRLFNYAAILVGAVPLHRIPPDPDGLAAAHRAAAMTTVAGTHFNRGQRAFFFALAYLGWFVGAGAFIAATAAALLVMWRRQFASDALAALAGAPR